MAYEFLKKLFGEVKEGEQPKAMTYEELEAAITADKSIQIVDLKAGGYVAKEKLDAKITELGGVKQQLIDANAEIQSYKDMDIEGIKKAAKDWETKYNTDTKALNDKLAEQERSHQLDRFMAGYKFTSKAAESGVRAMFNDKEFKLENGEFLGGAEYMKQLMEDADYKGAFVAEEPPADPEPPKPPKPHFAPPTPPTPPKGGKKMTLTEKMKYMQEHPDTDVNTLFE